MNRNSFLPAVTCSEEALLLGESLVLEDLKHEKKKKKEKKRKKIQPRKKNLKKITVTMTTLDSTWKFPDVRKL